MSNPRYRAIRIASSRKPRKFDRPADGSGRPVPVRDYYGSLTFGVGEMREHLPAATVRRFLDAIEHGHTLEPDLADRIAQGALDWALERGVTHFCHWFHPMTGSTAEKHDAFLSFDDQRPISRFTGEQLIQSEPDASSFPSGGIRTTFEARGYTAWDPTSPMFIMERTNGSTLCIPSAFFSYHGDALDKKTPLLRSMEAIHTQAVRLLHLLGDEDVTRVVATAGPEQEYFLVDRAYEALRPDLRIAGRTILGAPAPKGQTLEDHYFGAIPSRVLAFMHELEAELFKVGVPAQTRHNEVAPSQFELAVLYGEANVAADHNQLVMELIRKVAERHDYTALLHEKPFEGMNGSGKHLNWALADNLGRNLLDPGDNPSGDPRFLSFLAATLLGVQTHASVLRASIATHGNDFRLGANEAPPAIISAFLGDYLSAVCDAIVAGEEFHHPDEDDTIELGVHRMPQVARHVTDRNRTSPFAFTGNKFEFRAVGSNTAISWPLAVVNTVVADGIARLCDRIEEHGGGEEAIQRTIRETLEETQPIRFEGNNYDPEWLAEAERRGLPNLRTTPEALEVLRDEAATRLFETHSVLTPAELESRYHVKVERYISTVDIEVDVLRNLVNQFVLPAAQAERAANAGDIAGLNAALEGGASEDDVAHLRALDRLIADLRTARAKLDTSVQAARELEGAEQARYYAEQVMPEVEAVRAAADELEEWIADERWTLPRYREMLFLNT
ncbi:MAG: glutamine synthetase III [Myxococcota bacterium]